MYGLTKAGHSCTTYVVDLHASATPSLLDAVAYIYLRYALMHRCCRILVRAADVSALYALEPASAGTRTLRLRCYRIWVRRAPAGGRARTEA